MYYATEAHTRCGEPGAVIGATVALNARSGELARAACWAHCVVHQFHWADYRPSRWKLPRRRRGAAAFFLVCLVIAAAVWRALAPGTVPGPGDIPQRVRDRAALLFVLCWLPALLYLLRGAGQRRPIPFFATYGCLYSAYYAISPMFGIPNLLMVGGSAAGHPSDPASAYAAPINLLLTAWVLLLLGYRSGGSLPALRPTHVDRWLGKLRGAKVRDAAFAALGVGLTVTFVDRLGVVPLAFAGIVTLLKLTSQASVVVLIVLVRRGAMSKLAIGLAVTCIVATIFMELGGSATGGVMFLLFAVFTGFWVGQQAVSRRYLVVGLVTLAGCVAIRGVMDQWRKSVWLVQAGDVSPIERSNLMVTMLSDQVDARGMGGSVAEGWRVISRRSANTDLLIDVMRRTPDDIPYWDGLTYTSLVGAFVPRFFWPEKPQKSLGQDFGHRYGYISSADVQTSVNLPVVVEFYLNFGVAGVLVGMLLLGGVLRGIEDAINRPGQGYLVTAMATPFLARLLVMECDLSLMFGGLPMQLGTVYVLALVLLWIGGVIPARRRPRPPWYAPLPAGRPG